VNQAQSLAVMKNLLRSGIASIAYIRGLFPEDDFAERKIGDYNVKTIIPKQGNDAMVLNEWLEKGVFDALSKQYLDTIVFEVFAKNKQKPEDCDLLEQYEFKITYPDSSGGSGHIRLKNSSSGEATNVSTGIPKSHPYSQKEITESTMRMLRKLLVMAQTLQPLPTNRFLSMRLTYYDEKTPHDYEPAFFHKASKAMRLKTFDFVPYSAPLGSVSTKYHQMSIQVNVDDSEHVSGEELPLDVNSNDKQTDSVPASEESVSASGETNIMESSQFRPASSNITPKLNDGDESDEMKDFEAFPSKIEDRDYRAVCINRLQQEISKLEESMISERVLFEKVRDQVTASSFTDAVNHLVAQKLLTKLRGRLRGTLRVSQNLINSLESKENNKRKICTRSQTRRTSKSNEICDTKNDLRRSERLRRKISTVRTSIRQMQQ